MNDPILAVKDLKVNRGGVPVLDIPELTVQTGEFLSLIGPNGTGKSTLLLSLSGLLKRQEGEILFHG
jgi:ABC-type cobalamin/Fe3+-siderophores transport system ATPase subunit